jgi:hypothetical protein
VLAQVEKFLGAFSKRVKKLLDAGEDPETFAEPEISGVVGTYLTAIFSYPVARWLAERHGADVSVDIENHEDAARLGQTLPRFIPLLEEESLVEANVPYSDWLDAAKGKGDRALRWLIQRFESLRLSDREKAELYDSLQLYIHWKPRRRGTSRTEMILKKRKVFYHDGPLVSRKDISLIAELNSSRLPVEKLSLQKGEELLGMIRDTSAIRYRELHGFSFGDPRNVIRADAGRGVEFFLNGVSVENRLPLRAYHSVFMVKNGVPIGYAEGISLFERMEIGLNIYYTFRDGESAWLYARVLRLFKQHLGVTVFSVDPYQVGYQNEEGIESGAFWFYRKLGFRPVVRTIARLVEIEEKKIAKRTGYRTSPRKLRELSRSHMLFELSPNKDRRWDDFQIRSVGIAVASEMGKRFRGDASRMRQAALRSVSRALNVNPSHWSASEQSAFANMDLVLSLIPGLSRWSEEEKSSIVQIIRAKASAQESRFLRLMQRHNRLRDAVIKLGRALK